jgi:hypothetical protein
MLGYSYVSRAAGQGLVPARDTLAQLNELMPAVDRKKALAMAPSPPPSTAPTVKALRTAEAPPRQVTQRKVTNKPPKVQVAKAAAPERAPAPATGNWRIQLGAFSQRGGAEALYHRVSGKAVLQGRGPYYIAAGNVTRLQVGPFASRAAADAACRAIGTACFPVLAK